MNFWKWCQFFIPGNRDDTVGACKIRGSGEEPCGDWEATRGLWEGRGRRPAVAASARAGSYRSTQEADRRPGISTTRGIFNS